MPISPNLLERLIFLQLNQAPGPIFDLIGAVGFRAMVAALRLGLFDLLAGGPLTATEMARRAGADEVGVACLLDMLASVGYVRREGERYANTPMTARWLVRDVPGSFAPGMLFWGAILEQLWGDLETSLRTGASATNMYEWIEHEPEVSRNFQEWMVSLARVVGSEILDKLGPALPAEARRALDVGGGHGMYSIALCRRFPKLNSVVFDSPQALVTARQTIAAEGMEAQVSVREGDFMRDDLGGPYDVALLFNIIHGFQADDNVRLFRRAAAALNPGGLVAVVEQLRGRTLGPATAAINAMFGLSYFHVLNGGTHSYEQVANWLAQAGFGAVHRRNLLKAPGTSLVLASKIA